MPPKTLFSFSRQLRASTGGDIQAFTQRSRYGGQRGFSGCTDGRWWWSNGTWTTGAGCRARYGPRDALWKDGAVVRRAEPHVPLPDAWAWVPGEISLHLCCCRVSQSARTKPLTAALSPVANIKHRHRCGPQIVVAGNLTEKRPYLRNVLTGHFY